MSSRPNIGLRRIAPIFEAFPESATARGGQKEEDEKKEDKRRSRPPSPLPNRIIPLRRQTSIHDLVEAIHDLNDLAEAASSRHAQTSSIPPLREDPFAGMEQNLDRERLCIKAAKMVWDDLSQVLIWPMNDIDQSDEAMCERVTDLLGPDLRGEKVVLGDLFIAENYDGISIVDDRRLCGILVATEKDNPAKVRVADLANLKPQTGSYAVGYGEFDVASKTLLGSHVMIVKRGQQAVIEGRLRLRFFMRVSLDTDNRGAKIAARRPWNFRESVYDTSGPLWHEYFTKEEEEER